MNQYQQLTLEERYVIYHFRRENFSLSEIAESLGRSKSTISREISRNTGGCGYRPLQAHDRTIERRVTAHKKIKFTQEIQDLVDIYIKLDWSPEQVSNYLRLEHCLYISTKRIYQYIGYDRSTGGTLYKHLRQSHRKRRKRYGSGKSMRGNLKNRRSIDERPSIVDEKSREGDWEIDTVIGKNHKGALVTAVDRKTKYTLIGHVKTRDSNEVKESLSNLFSSIRDKVYTITSDNGKEFAFHEDLSEELDADFYFAHPYCSWERGLNENTNGLIRQYFPKKSDLTKVSNKKLDFVMSRLNNRPRKCLGFKTPAQIFENLTTSPGKWLNSILPGRKTAVAVTT